MVHFTALLASVALLSTRALAAPIPDSSANEPGVRAPNGIPITQSPDANADYGNNYGGGSYSTSTMMDDNMSTSTMMMNDKTSTMMDDNTTTSTSTMMDETTTSTTATYATSTMYGSGYNNWNSGYDSCVQQCMNSYGAPPATYSAPPSTTTATDNGGNGSTHTIVVAPAQGVLRFVPFAVNASVGDTLHFVWGGSPHTVTRSSILTPCNKTLDETNFFASGVQNKSFTFDLSVNETDTITYYCGVPGHCPKGMFGFVNPPNANGAATTVASMTPSLIANNQDLATQAMYVMNKTMGTDGYTWGDDIDMSNVPTELHEQFVQNVWMSKLLFAANPGMLAANKGAANTDGSAVVIPADITQMTLASAGGSTTSTTQAPAGVAAPTSASASTPSTTSKTGGAMSKSVASSAAVGFAVLVALAAL